MEMFPVVSTAVAAAGYDYASRVLRVTMTNGRTDDYARVTPAWFETFCKAESKGRFLVAVMKDKAGYPRRRVSHRYGRKPYSPVCLDCGCAKDTETLDTPCEEWAIPEGPAF